LASHTDQLGVFAAICAEWVAPGCSTSEQEQNKAPDNGDAADFLSGDVSGIFSAGRAW